MKKKPVRVKVKKPKSRLMDMLPNNHGEWLKVVIRLTEKGIAKNNTIGLDQQLQRLKKQLIDWEAVNL